MLLLRARNFPCLFTDQVFWARNLCNFCKLGFGRRSKFKMHILCGVNELRSVQVWVWVRVRVKLQMDDIYKEYKNKWVSRGFSKLKKHFSSTFIIGVNIVPTVIIIVYINNCFKKFFFSWLVFVRQLNWSSLIIFYF